MRMTVVPPEEGTVVTVCSDPEVRLPAAWARDRSTWTWSISASCCDRKTSPSREVQLRRSFIMSSTLGKATSDLTLGSQSWFCIAPSRSAPVTLGWSFCQRAASTTSSG